MSTSRSSRRASQGSRPLYLRYWNATRLVMGEIFWRNEQMVKKIRELLGLCQHKWGVLNIIPVYEYQSRFPVVHKYIMQCQHCGKIKAIRV